MNILGTLPAQTAAAASTLAQPASVADDQAASAAVAPASNPVGVKVSLSGEGLKKSADDKSANPNRDIEQSGLPDQTQKLLKMIRELKQKIEDKQNEIQAVMADPSLSPETRQARIGGLQSALATLTANLMTASNSLDKLSRNGTLSTAQAQQATQLAMK